MGVSISGAVHLHSVDTGHRDTDLYRNVIQISLLTKNALVRTNKFSLEH